MGEVVGLFIASGEGLPMQARPEVIAEAGRGLVGDRYYDDAGTFSTGGDKSEITFIEAESLEALKSESNIVFGADENRRNIVTRGVPLNHLVGQTFSVGSTVIEGQCLAEPCGYLEKLTGKKVRAALIHRGGLRAKIIRGGPIRVGDSISPATV
jgi:MOSC domain-containing protein YiiM